MDSDNIKITVATTEDSDRLMKFLHEHYYREEPLTVGCDPPEPDAADQEFLLSNLPYGTCVMAMDGERIVGAAVAGPKESDVLEHIYEDMAQHKGTKWGCILGILAIAERDANVFQRCSVNRALHVHAIGVDTSLRGRRIGERLVTALADRGRALDYPVFTSDCSSLYSARMMKRLGFELLNRFPYSSYVDDAGKQLIQPPAPHEYLETYVLRL